MRLKSKTSISIKQRLCTDAIVMIGSNLPYPAMQLMYLCFRPAYALESTAAEKLWRGYPLPRFLTTERHRVHPVLRRLLSTVRGAGCRGCHCSSYAAVLISKAWSATVARQTSTSRNCRASCIELSLASPQPDRRRVARRILCSARAVRYVAACTARRRGVPLCRQLPLAVAGPRTLGAYASLTANQQRQAL